MDVNNIDLYFLINSLAGGGAENVVLRLSRALNPKAIFLLERDVDYHVDGINIIYLSQHTKHTSPVLKTGYIPIYAKRLAEKVDSNGVVISFLERANFVNVIAKKLSKHRSIISVRTDPVSSHKGIRRINKLLVRFLYAKSDLIVSASRGIEENLVKLGIPESIVRVIYNPYNLREIKMLAEQNIDSVLSKAQYVINVGRLSYPKGQWYLIRIFKEVKKKFPNLKLLILGDGELKEYLVRISDGLGLKTYVWSRDEIDEGYDVYFMGFQENPYRYLAKAKLFIFTSLWEGFPNALVEAMACGVPVISADCRSGPREILAPNTDFRHQTDVPEWAEYGVLMPVFENKFLGPKDELTKRESIWADVVVKMLNDKYLRREYSKKAEKRAYEFNVDIIIKQWAKLLEQVV